MTDDIAEELSYQANDIIRNTITNMENALRDKISSKRTVVNDRIETSNKIQTLLDEYDSIKLELQGREQSN